MQCGILEEQGREALERARVEMEREKRSALALQNKVVELQTVSRTKINDHQQTIFFFSSFFFYHDYHE